MAITQQSVVQEHVPLNTNKRKPLERDEEDWDVFVKEWPLMMAEMMVRLCLKLMLPSCVFCSVSTETWRHGMFW